MNGPEKKPFTEISKDRDEKIRKWLKEELSKPPKPIDKTRVRKSLCPICGYPVFVDEIMIILPPEEDGMYAHEKCYKKHGREGDFWWEYVTGSPRNVNRRSGIDYFKDLKEEMEKRGIEKRCKVCLLRIDVTEYRVERIPVYMKDGSWAHKGCAYNDHSISEFTLLDTGEGYIRGPTCTCQTGPLCKCGE